MKRYALLSGANILCCILAENYKSAIKKANKILANEYRRKNQIRIVQVS